MYAVPFPSVPSHRDLRRRSGFPNSAEGSPSSPLTRGRKTGGLFLAACGLDLTGHASPERRDCLNQLLHSLHRRAGTHTFWPYALPGEPESGLTPRPDIFWSGLRELGVKMLIIMGSTASNAIGLSGPDVRPLNTIRANGCVICFTWDFAHIQEETNRLNQISRYIDEACRQLNF